MNSLIQTKSRGVVETVLAILLLLILLFDLFTVLSVFSGVFTYAIIFAVSLNGSFEKLASLLNNKRGLAAFIYGFLMILIIALPFIFIISALSDYAVQAEHWVANAKVNGVPALPDWIGGMPFVGKKITDFWQHLQDNPQTTIATYEPKLKSILQKLISGGAGIIGSILELVVGIIVSALLLANRDKILPPLYEIMRKLIGENEGPPLVDASGRAVRGVAVGVMGTAFIAALFAWIGYAIAGISFAIGLAALTFFMVVIQLGPVLIVIPVVIWLAMQGQTGWAIFITIYGLVVLMGIDNVLKPILIARSGKLPVLVLFLGVIGGMVVWGFTGMFKGAIILALFYTVLQSWLGRKPNVEPAITELK